MGSSTTHSKQNMKALLFVILILSVILWSEGKRMGGGGGYRRENQSYWRRRPWEVGYYSNRNNPRRYWESSWRRKQDLEEFNVKTTELPVFDEWEEEGCTGLCLIKKLEQIDSQLQEKEAEKEIKSVDEVSKKPEREPKKNPPAPCTGMCALMRQRTG